MARRNTTTESTDAAPANEPPVDEASLPAGTLVPPEVAREIFAPSVLPGPLVPVTTAPSSPPQVLRWEVRLTPHNPGTRIVGAANEVDAVKEYFRVMGIVRSDNMPKVTLVTDEAAAADVGA